MSINYTILPAHMQDAVRSYVEEQTDPGAFLTAILCNDFVEAWHIADPVNKEFMGEWAQFLGSELPTRYWGSKNQVFWHLNEGKS